MIKLMSRYGQADKNNDADDGNILHSERSEGENGPRQKIRYGV